MNKGKLIVLEGTDGSGKTTQLQLLDEYLTTNKIPHATADFPQYGKTFFGDVAGKALKGEYGSLATVSPYLMSIPYAADRWQAKPQLDQWIAEGKIVLVNRYATSNAMYQAAKLPEEKRAAFLQWNFDMEYSVFGIPKEDLVIYLHVPVDVASSLLEKKGKRAYLGERQTKDIHEANKVFQKEVERLYVSSCQTQPHWVKIECVQNGQLLSKEKIHEKIIAVLKEKNVL